MSVLSAWEKEREEKKANGTYKNTAGNTYYNTTVTNTATGKTSPASNATSWEAQRAASKNDGSYKNTAGTTKYNSIDTSNVVKSAPVSPVKTARDNLRKYLASDTKAAAASGKNFGDYYDEKYGTPQTANDYNNKAAFLQYAADNYTATTGKSKERTDVGKTILNGLGYIASGLAGDASGDTSKVRATTTSKEYQKILDQITENKKSWNNASRAAELYEYDVKGNNAKLNNLLAVRDKVNAVDGQPNMVRTALAGTGYNTVDELNAAIADLQKNNNDAMQYAATYNPEAYDYDDAQSRLDNLKELESKLEYTDKNVAPYYAMLRNAGQTDAANNLIVDADAILKGTGYNSVEEVRKARRELELQLKTANDGMYGINLQKQADADKAENPTKYNYYVALGEDIATRDSERREETTPEPDENGVVPLADVFSYANSDAATIENLTDDERAIYYYYKALESKGQVEEGTAKTYLHTLSDKARYRSAEETYSNLSEGGDLAKYMFGMYAGLDQFNSGMSSLANGAYNYATGKAEALPTSAAQMASGMVRESLSDSGIKSIAYDLETTTANMLPSMAMSAMLAAAGLAPAASAVGAATLGASAAGNSYNEMLQMGYSNEQATVYGTLTGLSEAGLEYVLGGISALGSGVASKLTGGFMQKLLSGINSAFGQFAITYGVPYLQSLSGEALEEGLQDILEPVFKWIATGEPLSIPEDYIEGAMYSAFLGALSAGVLEGPHQISGLVSDVVSGYQMKNNNDIAQAYIEQAKKYDAGTVAARIANRVDENTGALSYATMLHDMGAQLTEQNKADITQALIDEGMTASDADVIAKWLNKAVDGEYFNKAQQAALENNPIISKVFINTVSNMDSDVSTRTALLHGVQELNGTDMVEGREERRATEQTYALKQAAASATKKAPVWNRESKLDYINKTNENIENDFAKKRFGFDFGRSAERVTGNTEEAVTRIASVSEDGVTYANKTGDTVEAADATFVNEDQSFAFEGAANMAVRYGLNENQANLIAHMNTGDTSTLTYLMGVEEALNYGAINMNVSKVSKSSDFNKLTEAQRNTFYKMGRESALARDEARTTEIKKSINEKAQRKNGKLVMNIDRSTISAESRQAESIGAVEALIDAGVITNTVHIFDTSTVDGRQVAKEMLPSGRQNNAPNGLYVNGKGEIWIDINAGNSRQGVILWTLCHELTHFAAEFSPKQFRALSDFLMEKYNKSGVPVERLIAAQMAAAKRGGNTITYQQAWEEVVADSMQRMFTDTNAAQSIRELQTRDATLVEKIKQWFDDLIKKIKAAYKGLDSDTAAAEYLLKTGKDMQKIADMFAAAIADANENFAQADVERGLVASMSEEELSARVELGDDLEKIVRDDDGEMLVAVGKGKVVYSEVTYYKKGREALIDALREKGHTEEEIQQTVEFVDERLENIKQLGEQYARKDFKALFTNLNKDVTYNAQTGKQTIYAFTPNGDYPANIDLQLNCKKRIMYGEMMDRLIADGVMENVRYGAEAIAEVNMILARNEFETACLGCFVESRRQQLQKWAETLVSEWNENVEKVNPNATYFFENGSNTVELEDALSAHAELEKSKPQRNKKGNLQLGKGGPYVRMGRLIAMSPDLYAHKLRVSDVLTADGLANIRAMVGGGEIFSMIVSRYGVASPKIVQSFNPYNSEILNLAFQQIREMTGESISSASYIKEAKLDIGTDYDDVAYSNAAEILGEGATKKDIRALAKKMKDQYVAVTAFRNYLYDIGGLRIQSFSDFMIENVFDMLQMFTDMATMEYAVHGYTKEISCLRLFGMNGAKWNGSLIAHVDRALGEDHAGLTEDTPENRKYGIPVNIDDKSYVIQFDDYYRHDKLGAYDYQDNPNGSFIQSIGYKDVIATMLDPRYSKNVGNITIGVSDIQIRAMLNNPLFRMVIPYHKSGMLRQFAELVGVSMYNDYTNFQNTTINKAYDENGDLMEWKQESGDYFVKKNEPGANWIKINPKFKFDFNAEFNKTGDARQAATNYIEWCRDKNQHVVRGKYNKFICRLEFNPKFSNSPNGYDFTKERNYYKLLEDFNVYDAIEEIRNFDFKTGKVIDENAAITPALQGPVTMRYLGEDTALTAEELDAYRADLKSTGLFTDKDIEKYVKKAQQTFDDVVKEQVEERQEYNAKQSPLAEPVYQEIKNTLIENYSREGGVAESSEEYKDAADAATEKAAEGKTEAANKVSKKAPKGSYKTQQSERITAEQDAEYLELAKDPEKNKARLSEMVDNAAKRAGYNYRGYHGTTTGTFATFKKGFTYHATDIKTASYYSQGDTDVLMPLELNGQHDVDKGTFNEMNKYLKKMGGHQFKKMSTEQMQNYAVERYKMWLDSAVNNPATKTEIANYNKKLEALNLDGATSELVDFVNALKKHSALIESIVNGKEITYADIEAMAELDSIRDAAVESIDFHDYFHKFKPVFSMYNMAAGFDEYISIPSIENAVELTESVANKDMFAVTKTGKYGTNSYHEIGDVVSLADIKKEVKAAKKIDGNITRGGIYDDYIKLDKPFVIDAKGNQWEHITLTDDKIGTSKYHQYSTDEICEWAYNNGYDGVVFKNVFDYALNDYHTTDDIVVFGSSQIKSAQPVVYDDDYDVIPLSERFNEKNEDIRFSERTPYNRKRVAKSRKSWYNDFESLVLQFKHGSAEEGSVRVFFKNNNAYYYIKTENGAELITEGEYDEKRDIISFAEARSEIDETLNLYGSESRGSNLSSSSSAEENTYAGISGQSLRDELRNDIPADIEDGIGNQSGSSDLIDSSDESGVKLSEREENATDARTLLSNALMTATQNAAERDELKRYQSTIEKLNADQQELDRLRTEIHTMAFTKGRSTQELNNLRNNAETLAKRIARNDKALVQMEAAEPLRQLIARERKVATRQAKKAASEALSAYRTQAEERLQAVKEHGQEIRARSADRRKRSEVKKKISNVMTKLSNTLHDGTKTTHMPSSITGMVDALLKAINENDVNADLLLSGYTDIHGVRHMGIQEELDKLPEKTQKKIDKAETDVEIKDILRDAKIREDELLVEKANLEFQQQQVLSKLALLKTAYDAMESNKRGKDESIFYNPVVSAMLGNTVELIQNKATADMTVNDLNYMLKTLTALDHTINKALTVKIGEKQVDAFHFAEALMRETNSVSGNKDSAVSHYIERQMRPQAMFNRLGNYTKNSYWNQLYKLLDDGQLTQTRLEVEGQQIFAELFNDKENRKQLRKLSSYAEKDLVDIGLKDRDGNTIKITRGMMLAVYRALQNDQNIRHIMYGGYTIPDFKKYYHGKKDDAFGTGARRTAVFSDEVIEANDKLRAEQAKLSELKQAYYSERLLTQASNSDKLDRMVRGIRDQEAVVQDAKDAATKATQNADAIVGTMQRRILSQITEFDNKVLQLAGDFFDGWSKEQLNKTTLEEYGIERASVKNYLPIHTDEMFLEKEFESISRDLSLENVGFMQERVGGGNPIVMEDITDMMNGQIKGVAKYCGLMPALNTFNSITSKSTARFGDSVLNAVRSKFGKAGVKYIENLKLDLVGGRNTESTLFDRARGMMAGSVLSLNPRVALAQAASYPTAAAVVGYGPLIKAFFTGEKSKVPIFSRADADLIMKYSPLLAYRMKGYSSAEIGDATTMATAGSKFANATRFAMGWIQAMDGATVGRLWYASENYVKKNNSDLDVGTEEYYKAVADVFNKVVEETQPNYTTMQRPDILRSNNDIVKQLTMFMTQRLQNVNILYDAAAQLNRYRQDYKAGKNGVTAEDVRQASGSLARAVTSQFIAAVTIVGMKALTDAAMHNMNGYRDDDDELTMEALSKKLGSNMADTLISSILGGSEFYSVLTVVLDKLLYDKKTTYYGPELNGVQAYLDVISNFVNLVQEDWVNDKGEIDIPYDTIEDMIETIANLTGLPVGNLKKIAHGAWDWGTDIINGEAGTFEAGTDRTKKQTANLYYKAIKAGDTAAIKKHGEVLGDKADDRVRESVKADYQAGNISSSEAIRILTKYGDRDENAAYWLVQEWGDTDDSYTKYDDFYAAVQSGKNLKTVISTYTKYGVSTTTLAGKITGYFKPIYIKATTAQRASLKGYLLNAYEALGYDRTEKGKDIDKWVQ